MVTRTPVIILGLGRSGSTLVGAILGAHSRFRICDEWWFLAEASRHIEQGCPLEVSRSVRLDAWRAWLRVMIRAKMRGAPTARFGEKCPGLASWALTVDDLFSGDVQFIWTIRHPIDLALSWMERWKPEAMLHYLANVHDVTGFSTDRSDLIRALLQAYRQHTVYLERLLERCSNRVHLYRYEEFVRRPTKALSKLHAFLGESPEPNQIAAAFGESRLRILGGDPKFNHTQTVHSESIGRWRELSKGDAKLFAAAFNEYEIASCMDFLGYREELKKTRHHFKSLLHRWFGRRVLKGSLVAVDSMEATGERSSGDLATRRARATTRSRWRRSARFRS